VFERSVALGFLRPRCVAHRREDRSIGDAAPKTLMKPQRLLYEKVGKVVRYRESMGNTFNAEAYAVIARDHGFISAAAVQTPYGEFHDRGAL
jgi:hypothetical protein